KTEHTFVWHVWEVVSADGTSLGRVEAEDAPRTVVVDGRASAAPQGEVPQRDTARGGRGGRDRSPDGKWTASIKDHNLVVRSTDKDADFQLTNDGREGLAYGMPQWSPIRRRSLHFALSRARERKCILSKRRRRVAGGRCCT